jgi:hypothetical protein
MREMVLKYLFARRLERIQEEHMATFNVEMERLKMQYEDKKQEAMDNLVTFISSVSL